MIHISGGVSEYPYTALDHKVISYFNVAARSINKASVSDLGVILRSLECYLQITSQTLGLSTIQSSKFIKISSGFVGAINDPSLFNFSKARKHIITSTFLNIAQHLEVSINAPKLPNLHSSVKSVSEDVQNCILEFQELRINEEKLWLWSGWPCESRGGHIYWAPLFPVYVRLGRTFTERLHLHCKEYLSGRSRSGIICFKEFTTFIGSYKDELNPELFQRPEFVTKFLRLFLIHYIESGYANGEGLEISTLVNAWRTQFIHFVEFYLIKSGLIAEPWGELPTPHPLHQTKGPQTHRNTNLVGDLVSEKLLTDIPLHITDEVALRLLFKQIRLDVEIAKSWALWAAEDLWYRAQCRLQNSDKGTVISIGATGINSGKSWSKDRRNPDHIINAAATYNFNGHIASTYDAKLLLPSPLQQSAYDLGLPTSSSLLPHCILLIINHPSITPSFLENFELYDKDGKQKGLIIDEGVYKLVSYKRRRGAKHAQQTITLNELTAKIVLQMISITDSIRSYLKSNNQDSWRFLLLTAKRGFAKPARIKKLATDTHCPIRLKKFAESLQMTSDLSLEERDSYVKKFSLSKLRASCGVLVYLETRSLSEMSKALGHIKLDPGLIKRYLPEPIAAFFQERWIRIFQAALVIETLKDSPYLVDACGFASIHEIDAFLHSHALKIPPGFADTTDTTSNAIEHPKEKVVFGINSAILTLLLSIEQAVKDSQKAVHEKANYWAELTKHLVSEIEIMDSFRPDLKTYLDFAKSHVNPSSVKSIIYG